MRTIRLLSIIILGLGGLGIQALPTTLEPVLVKELRQKANLMPPIRPGENRVQSIFTLEVQSNGCTSAADFTVTVFVTKSGQFVEVKRVKPDLCELAIPVRKTIDIETPNMQLSTMNPVILRNPVFADEQVAH